MTFTDDLEREPWRFDFFASLRRIERSFPDLPRIGDSATRREDYVSLGEDPYLAFPASTLCKADRDLQGRMRVFAKFLGMLGPQGPLPLAITEESYAWWLARDDSFPRFLDLFNNRFLQLFFRAWADARPIAQHDHPSSDRFEAYIGSVVGLGSKPFRSLDSLPDAEKLAYAGLMAPVSKSATRLRDLLSGLFKVDAQVEQFVGSRLVFEEAEQTRLGQTFCVIGADALLGSRIFSVQDKIRVRLVTSSLAQYERFLPSGDLCDQVADALFFYVGDQLEVDVELAIPAPLVAPMQLGHFGRLGWTGWVAPDWADAHGTMRSDARFHPADVRASSAKWGETWPTSALKS